MNIDQAITDELRMLESRLATLPRVTPFAQPEHGYFSGLTASLAEMAQFESAPDPAKNWGKEQPFDVPDGYFDGLAAALNRATQLDAASEIQPFAVPEGYFTALPATLLAAAKAESEAPVLQKTVRFPVLRRSMPWLAAAAILCGVWFGMSRNTISPSADNRALSALASLDQDSIGQYVELHADDFDPENLEAALAGAQITDFTQVVSELQSDEIEEYLNDDAVEQRSGDGT